MAETDAQDDKQCWICFDTEAEDVQREIENDPRDYGNVSRETLKLYCTWVSPCKCSGASKWVHQGCIQRWIDEKQKGRTYEPVKCPQCKEIYHVHVPRAGLCWSLYERLDWLITEMSPFVSMGFVTAGFYASCTSYGAFAICQMYGLVPGHRLIQRMPSFVFFTAVPMIPFLLVIPRLYSPALLASILSVSTNTVTGRVMPDGQVVYNDDDVLWEDVPGDAEDTSTRASRTNSFSTDTHEGLEASNVRDTDDRRSRAGSQDAYEVVFDLDIGGSTPGARTPRTSLNRGIEHADYMNPGDSIDAGEYPQINNGRQDYVQDSMIQIDVDLGQGTFRDGTPFTRILAGGLMLPVVSAYVGNLLFYGRLQSTRIQRSLLGGFIYLTVRQCVKKLYAITLEKRLERRLVLDMPRPSDYLNEST